MSVETVKEFFTSKGLEVEILRFEDTSTVDKAAASLGVTPGEIAKSMLFKVRDDYNMVIVAGDKRIDNRKYKDAFSYKAKMPNAAEVEAATGHPVGGVCPFGLQDEFDVFLDVSLKAYDTVYPAAGDVDAALKISVSDLAQILGDNWVDICK